uniref:Gluconokinase n=1 Tax=Cacopsylla melanoneura TaxID=428564 RepID=A0A8D8WZB1_9HEMI
MSSVSGDTRPYSTCFVLMGVSGSGKSIIGESLANRLGVQFIDGDNLHPKSNIEKMSAKIPLTDEDRRPWLEQIQQLVHQWNVDNVTGVVVCSALKKKYRDIIRSKSHKRTEDSIRQTDDGSHIRSNIHKRTEDSIKQTDDGSQTRSNIQKRTEDSIKQTDGSHICSNIHKETHHLPIT